jgi:hypothetical protein
VSTPVDEPVAVAGEPPTTSLGSGWLGLVVPGLLIAFLTVRTAAPLRDQDTFWHLASGRDLLDRWTFIGPDPLSHFTTGQWVRHAWLPDIIFAETRALGGNRLVALLLPLMTALVLVTLYLALRSRTAGVLLSCLLLAVVFIGMSGSLSARPQVISFGFTAAVTALWLRGADRGRPPWVVIPLTWLWASCHGLWLLSPLIGGAVTLGMVIGRRDGRTTIRCAAVVVGSVAVAALTPVGPALLTAPFQVGRITPYVQEWQPPGVLSAPVLAVAVLVGATLLAWAARRRPGLWGEVLLLAACVPLTATARRTAGMAAIIAAIVAARALQEALPLHRDRFRRAEAAALACSAVLGVALSWLVLAASPPTQGFPDALSPQLAALPRGTTVCNEYEVGSWLLAEHPGLVPVLDGRTELFTPADLDAALSRSTSVAPWGALVSSSGCTAALVPTSGPGSLWFAAHPPWRFVGSNAGWGLYTLSG